MEVGELTPPHTAGDMEQAEWRAELCEVPEVEELLCRLVQTSKSRRDPSR